jgi:hypothetical protein
MAVIITQKVNFKGRQRPPSGPYNITLGNAIEILEIPINTAIFNAFTPTDQWQVGAQSSGNPMQIIYLESTTQARMDYAINSTPPTLKIELYMLKSLVKNTQYSLRIFMTDKTGLNQNAKVISPNTNIVIK